MTEVDHQGLAAVLLDDVEQLEDALIGGLVELVLQRPHVIGMLGHQLVGGSRGAAQPLALAAPGGTHRPSSCHNRYTRLRLTTHRRG